MENHKHSQSNSAAAGSKFVHFFVFEPLLAQIIQWPKTVIALTGEEIGMSILHLFYEAVGQPVTLYDGS